jgi:cytochrome d ubiquinol oxidase subunit II
METLTLTAQPLLQTLSQSPSALQITWFLLVGVLLALYAILDGYDLGVGMLHRFARTDEERRILLNSIGPVWDGNEVYLITGGGALFAAFPEVYATVFSGFYLALILLLLALIFRATSIEFRSKEPMLWWRAFWDNAFNIGSFVAALLLGVALGNIARGIPLDAEHEYAGGFFTLLNPYALLVGLTTVALFAQQGALWVIVKTEGALQQRFRTVARWAIAVFTLLYALTTLATLYGLPHMLENLAAAPLLWLVPALAFLAAIATPWLHSKGKEVPALISSSLTAAGLMGCFGLSVYPNMVRSSPDLANSLTLVNGSSSPKTLQVMLIIACIGMPLVLGYTILVHTLFRGKVKLEKESY